MNVHQWFDRLLLLGWLALLGSLGCSRPAVRVPEPAAPGATVLEVVCYNVNYGVPPSPEVLALLQDRPVDLVLLQEATPAWEEVGRTVLAGQYPFLGFHHAPGAGGIGFFSRRPILEEELLPPPPGGWFPAQYLVVSTERGPVQVLNVHLHPPVNGQGSLVAGYFTTGGIRGQELQRFLTRLRPGWPALIGGDLNEARGEALEALGRAGFVTALPEFRHTQPTWRWHTSLGTLRAQLDHLAYGPGLQPLDVRVLDLGRSDHLPLFGIFEIQSS